VQVPILQPNACNGVVNVAQVSIHAPMSSPVSPPPSTLPLAAALAGRRTCQSGGEWGGERWGRLVAPPLEQLARVHAVDGSRLIRTEVQLFPSNPRGVSSLRKRMRGGGAPVTTARLPSNMIMSTFVPFINGFIPASTLSTDTGLGCPRYWVPTVPR
jgi:hypothetical protein